MHYYSQKKSDRVFQSKSGNLYIARIVWCDAEGKSQNEQINTPLALRPLDALGTANSGVSSQNPTSSLRTRHQYIKVTTAAASQTQGFVFLGPQVHCQSELREEERSATSTKHGWTKNKAKTLDHVRRVAFVLALGLFFTSLIKFNMQLRNNMQ